MEMRAPPVAAGGNRSLWWRVHHWAGLKLGVLLSFVLMTGTIATIADEIDWLVTPAMRAMPRSGAMAGWEAWLRAASLPGAVVEEIRAPIEPGFAARAKIRLADGDERLVHINPWTGERQGLGSTATVQDVVRDLHRSLMLPTDIGIPLVGFLSIPLLVTLVTAFKVYKKWWRGFARWPRPMRNRREIRRYLGDLHRLAGVWSLWFIALIGTTGLWYFAERLGVEVAEPAPPSIATHASPRPAVSLDKAIANARRDWPSFRIRGVVFEGDHITLEGQGDAILVRDRANALWLDTHGRLTIGAHDSSSMTLIERVAEAADPLHFGNWGGLVTKVLWFVFGLILSTLAVTGTLVTAYRLAGPGQRARILA